MSTGNPGAGNSRRGAAEPAVPQDLEAEAAVLGALLIDPAATAEVSPLLSPADFFREKNGWVYEACLALHERGQRIDQVTVMHELHSHDRLEAVGGVAYVTELVVVTPTSAHAADYAAIVAECAVKRRLIEVAGEMARLAYNGLPSGESITSSIARLTALRRVGAQMPEPRSFADVGEVVRRAQFVWENWLSSGVLHLLAAEPGQGKSILALYIAGCFLRGDPWPDGVPFSGETGEVLWCECESAHGLNYARIERSGLSATHLKTPLEDPLGDVRLDDPQHRARIAAYARREEMRLVVVDSFSGATRRDENNSSAADNAFWLAALARDTGLPVLCVHHLRKSGMSDRPGIVTLDRLRGHGAITQPARIIWALDVPNPARREDRRLSVIKTNLGAMPPAIGMGIDDNGCYFGAPPETPHEDSLLDRAADLMASLLASGARLAQAIQQEFRDAGISRRTMYRAKDRLHVVTVRRDDGWWWSLPSQRDTP